MKGVSTALVCVLLTGCGLVYDQYQDKANKVESRRADFKQECFRQLKTKEIKTLAEMIKCEEEAVIPLAEKVNHPEIQAYIDYYEANKKIAHDADRKKLSADAYMQQSDWIESLLKRKLALKEQELYQSAMRGQAISTNIGAAMQQQSGIYRRAAAPTPVYMPTQTQVNCTSYRNGPNIDTMCR